MPKIMYFYVRLSKACWCGPCNLVKYGLRLAGSTKISYTRPHLTIIVWKSGKIFDKPNTSNFLRWGRLRKVLKLAFRDLLLPLLQHCANQVKLSSVNELSADLTVVCKDASCSMCISTCLPLSYACRVGLQSNYLFTCLVVFILNCYLISGIIVAA